MTRPPTGRCPVCKRPLRKAGVSTNRQNVAPWHKSERTQVEYRGSIGTTVRVFDDCPGTGRTMLSLHSARS